ncbi:MAG: circularly permuted type 2 ATP-grasp protein, partial [Planctomycetia bacterium]
MNQISPITGKSFMGYGPLGHNHDEMLFTDGQIRPHWRDFTHGLDELGPEEFQNRWMESRQIIRENGITYNVYGDPRGLDRPWQLDPIPFIISPEEYEYLGKGLTQRACLLEAILADIYGPQLLLKNGWLPPEIVFANPGFLRPCHGISLSGRRHLHLTAFDVGRGADGNLWILGDRTQAPSGAGYALENRIVLSRMLPELFRQCKVERLAMFFRNLRDTVRALAPNNRDNPRTVLLSPGPY